MKSHSLLICLLTPPLSAFQGTPSQEQRPWQLTFKALQVMSSLLPRNMFNAEAHFWPCLKCNHYSIGAVLCHDVSNMFSISFFRIATFTFSALWFAHYLLNYLRWGFYICSLFDYTILHQRLDCCCEQHVFQFCSVECSPKGSAIVQVSSLIKRVFSK